MLVKHRNAEQAPDRRKHQRVPVALPGRYMLPSREEHPCQSIDLSPGGAALLAPVKALVGDRVIVYLEQIGRLEGTATRHLDKGFAIAMALSPAKRERIADQLTWLANRHALGMREDRRHERIEPIHKLVTVAFPNEREVIGRIIDVSLSGAAIQCECTAKIGASVMIGTTASRVVRVSETGIAVEFAQLLPIQRFGPDIRL